MGLMTGAGPFGLKPAGTWNFQPPAPGRAVYTEPIAKRVRAEFAGQTVVDSTDVLLVSESGLQPVYYFPPSDVDLDLLERTERHTWCPTRGDASYFSMHVGDRVEDDVAWCYPEPLAGVMTIKERIAFDFHRMDRWFEED